MAIKLQSLYEAINNQFDVILHSNSFYDKEVTWIHTVEQGEFSHLLHGDELIFNSGLNFTSQDWLKEFLKSLKDAHASGLIISVKSRPAFSQEIIDYCNEIQLPLFSTSWDTPFIDIMRIFSEILLKNEHRETSSNTDAMIAFRFQIFIQIPPIALSFLQLRFYCFRAL